MIEPYNEIYSLNEQALLLEKEISFKNGSFQLANGLKMSRLIDRIELLHYKTTGIKLNQSDTWFSALKQSINLRNKLVHPKDAIELTDRQVEIAISSVIETVNHLYQAVYKKKLPYYNLGLSSKFDIK